MDELQNASMAAKAKRAEAKEIKKTGITRPEPKTTSIESSKVSDSVKEKSDLETVRSAEESSPNIVNEQEVKLGRRVTHTKFGDGVIVSRTEVDNDGRYQVVVRFENGAEKMLSAPLVFQKGFLRLRN